ncbi:XRE family transcriptional regulator [Paraburkholderia sp.]|uniref:helix-turn-helix domain-containing protein n=1 Tax=Paraburkholderia sp. TaxID=1926495 RepID=UPI002394370B|nr:XRE family transcriptional regulator [Paraburkholderia sp.]MDE1184282.1 XRE family transcriptional regulator [Paraburkholderia sp.]
MSDPSANDLSLAIAARVKTEREARNWSLSALAERSGVSKAMISKIERGEASPTATVLGRLSGAFGLALSTLLALAEQTGDRLNRHAQQAVWVDPESGYSRRRISPANGGMLELLEVELPPRVRVPYPSDAFVFQHQQIWVEEGELTFREGAQMHRLEAGDCLQLGSAADCEFINAGHKPCRYIVALVRR